MQMKLIDRISHVCLKSEEKSLDSKPEKVNNEYFSTKSNVKIKFKLNENGLHSIIKIIPLKITHFSEKKLY